MRLLFGVCLAAVAVAFVWACGSDNQVCGTCPKVAGTWALTAGQPDVTCPNDKAPPQTMTITQVGSTVRSTVDGNELSGTVFDTFDFTLSGNVGGGTGGADAGVTLPDTVQLRAKFNQGAADAGDTFRGTWTFTPAADAGAQTCSSTRDVTANRVQ